MFLLLNHSQVIKGKKKTWLLGLRPHERRMFCPPSCVPFRFNSACSADALEHNKDNNEVCNTRTRTEFWLNGEWHIWLVIPGGILNESTTLPWRYFHVNQFSKLTKSWPQFIVCDASIQSTNKYLKVVRIRLLFKQKKTNILRKT